MGYHGWMEIGVGDGGSYGWAYYPESTPMLYNYAIRIYAELRVYDMYTGGPVYDILVENNGQLPDGIRTMEEAKAWTLAVWRMHSGQV